MNKKDALSKPEAAELHRELIQALEITCATVWHTHPHYRDMIIGVLLDFVRDHATDAELYEMRDLALKRTHRAKVAHMQEVK